MKTYSVLYHVTTDDRLEGIQDRGVDPAYSEGKRAVSWYVADRQTVWACLHVAQRRNVRPDRLAVCVVNLPDDLVKRTCWKDVFTCNHALIPSNYSSVTACLRDYEAWLRAIEHEAERRADGQ